ncbi:MAG: hypothetical protein KGO82_20550 [Bacteroidota bacterium]|nr:hypothetical protein [Bacteroidota bacterium]
MYKALQISPMIPSFDISKTMGFFTDLLGFTIYRNDGHYVILQKDYNTIHLLRAGQDIGEMEFYLEVDDIDQVWINIQDRLDGIKHKAPFEQVYGMKEIHIVVPATNTLLFIGESTK